MLYCINYIVYYILYILIYTHAYIIYEIREREIGDAVQTQSDCTSLFDLTTLKSLEISPSLRTSSVQLPPPFRQEGFAHLAMGQCHLRRSHKQE
jgi:hypothetical protein